MSVLFLIHVLQKHINSLQIAGNRHKVYLLFSWLADELVINFAFYVRRLNVRCTVLQINRSHTAMKLPQWDNSPQWSSSTN